jgi:hypothetical protein
MATGVLHDHHAAEALRMKLIESYERAHRGGRLKPV